MKIDFRKEVKKNKKMDEMFSSQWSPLLRDTTF